jgi:hypothetical protein
MRSAGGTKSAVFSRVTFSTKVVMAFFEGPSFHDGSGSAANVGQVARNIAATNVVSGFIVNFISLV